MEAPSQTMLLTRVKTDIRELLSARFKVPVGLRSEKKVAPKESELIFTSAANAHQNTANAKLPTTVSMIRETTSQETAAQDSVPIPSISITASIPPAELDAIEAVPQADAISSAPTPNVEIPVIKEVDSQGLTVRSEAINAKEETIIQPEIVPSPLEQVSATNLQGEQSNPKSVVDPSVDSIAPTQQDSQVQESSATVDTPSVPTLNFLSHLKAQIQDCQKPLYGLNVSIDSTTLQRRTRGLYIGLLPEWPVPKHAEDQWEIATQTGISLHERLMFDLLKAAQKQLGQIDSELEHIELELRMIGHATRKAKTVDLKPAILVRCRTRKCRKVLRQAISDLAYIPATLHKESAAVKLHAPRPANLQVRQTALSTPPAQSNRTNAIAVGVGVGAGVFGLLIAFALGFLFYRRKTKKRGNDVSSPPYKTGLAGYAPPVSELSDGYENLARGPQDYGANASVPPFHYSYQASTLGGSTIVGSMAPGSNPDLIIPTYGSGGTYYPYQGLAPLPELRFASSPTHELSEMPYTMLATPYPVIEVGSATQPPHSPDPVQERGSIIPLATSSAQPSGSPSRTASSPTLENTRGPVTSADQDLSGSTSLTPFDLENRYRDSLELSFSYSTFIETSPYPSICGLKYKWIFERPGPKIELISTVGGMLRVNDELWGLTTAHAIFTASRRRAFQDKALHKASHKKALLSQTSSNNSTPGESESESFTEGEEWEEDSEELGDVPASRLVVDGLALGQTPRRDTQWTRVFSLGPTSFAGYSDISGYEIIDLTPSVSCDFALICLNAPHASLLNSYYIQADGQPSAKVCVEGIMKDNELTPGPVLVLTRPCVSEQAYMLPGKSLFSMYKHSFITRKLRLEKPLAAGSSGSWVVRDGRLCGYIVAVYQHEPYAHIITAENALSDIRTVLQFDTSGKDPKILRVATTEDLTELGGHATSV